MGALSFGEIKNYLKKKDPQKRLVVTPLLDPKEQLNIGQAAIDVRLGRGFSLVRAWTQGVAELVSTINDHIVIEQPLESTVLDFGQPLIIHPHQFVLARTLEMVRLPKNLLAYVIGRSSWGRRGLIVATATVIHPGFSGPITLELKNVGETPIALYPFDRIAQLTFHEVAQSKDNTLLISQFASNFIPKLGHVRDKATKNCINQMVSDRENK